MKTKKLFARIIATLVAGSFTAFNAFAAVQDVSINPNSTGEVYLFDDEFYFLDVYSSETKLIDAAELEGALDISVRLNVTNAENYDEDIDVTLDIEVDENDFERPSYYESITLNGDGTYTISLTLDDEFEVNPDTLGIFLSLDFWGDPPAENQVPNIEVLEIIVKKDVEESNTDNTGDTGSTDNTGDTGSTDNTGDTGSTDNTGDTGSTDNTGDTGSTDNTGDTGSTDNTGDTGSTDNTDETGSTGSDGSNTPNTGDSTPLMLLVAIATISAFGLCITVKKGKARN